MDFPIIGQAPEWQRQPRPQRPPKAADIEDFKIVGLVRNGIRNLSPIQQALPNYPPKVVLAKLAQMVNKGRLKGCACGCRGDFEIPHPAIRSEWR